MEPNVNSIEPSGFGGHWHTRTWLHEPLRAVFALGAFLYAAVLQYLVSHGQDTPLQLVLYLGAGVLFAVTVPLSGVVLRSLPDSDAPAAPTSLRPWAVDIGTSYVVLAASLYLFWENRQRGIAFALWWLAMIWFVGGILWEERPALPRPRLPRGDRAFAIGVAAILLGVTAVTFYRLDSIPYGLWWDEANFALYAQQILHHTLDFPFLAPFGDPSLEFYVHAIEQQLFGPTQFGARVVTALCGIATVALLGALAASLWNRAFALVAMAVLGFMRWHIDFSRFTLHEMPFQAIELGVLLALVIGFRRRRPVPFAVCGVLLGLAQQIYSPALPLAGLVLTCLVYGLVLSRPRLPRAYAALLVLGFVVAYAPFQEAGVQNPSLFNARAKQVSIFSSANMEPPLQALEHNLRLHALMFNVRGDSNGRHSIPNQPQLDGLAAVLFLLGLAFALRYSLVPQYAFLILWFLAMMAPGVLSLDFEAPQSGRAAGAQPAVAIFIALALWSIASCVQRAFDDLRASAPLRQWSLTLVCVPALIVTSVTDVSAYFDAQQHNEAVWEVYSTDATFVGYEARRLSSTDTMYISPELDGEPTIQYLAPNHPPTQTLDPSLDLPFESPGTVAVFLTRDDQYSFPLLRSYYPRARFDILHTVQAGIPPLAYAAIIPARDVQRDEGLQFTYRSGGAVVRRHVADLRSPAGLSARGGTATWSGGVRIPTYGRAALMLESNGQAVLSVDGRKLCSGTGRVTCDTVWARGDHGIVARVKTARGRAPTLRWQWNGPESLFFFAAPLAGHGLTAAYYPNASWAGAPSFVQMEPQVNYFYQNVPLTRPFTVRWQGSLFVPRTGTYSFALDSIDDSWLEIDGHPVLHSTSHLQATTPLKRGWHRVEARLLAVNNFTHIFLSWQTPGSLQLVPVPSRNFRP